MEGSALKRPLPSFSLEMRQCAFCGRWFRNKRAVEAHLRYCPMR
jgi:hypothetical protein